MNRQTWTIFQLTRTIREGHAIEVFDEFGAHTLSDSGKPGYMNVDGKPTANGIVAEQFGFYDASAPVDADVWKISGFIK